MIDVINRNDVDALRLITQSFASVPQAVQGFQVFMLQYCKNIDILREFVPSVDPEVIEELAETFTAVAWRHVMTLDSHTSRDMSIELVCEFIQNLVINKSTGTEEVIADCVECLKVCDQWTHTFMLYAVKDVRITSILDEYDCVDNEDWWTVMPRVQKESVLQRLSDDQFRDEVSEHMSGTPYVPCDILLEVIRRGIGHHLNIEDISRSMWSPLLMSPHVTREVINLMVPQYLDLTIPEGLTTDSVDMFYFLRSNARIVGEIVPQLMTNEDIDYIVFRHYMPPQSIRADAIKRSTFHMSMIPQMTVDEALTASITYKDTEMITLAHYCLLNRPVDEGKLIFKSIISQA